MKSKNRVFMQLIAVLDIIVFLTAAKMLPFISSYDVIIGVMLVIFLLMLYVAGFYSFRHSRSFKFASTFIALLAVFDAANVIVQYVFLYELVYGRKVLILFDIILFIYFTYRWVIINRRVINSKMPVYMLCSGQSSGIADKIKSEKVLVGMGLVYKGICEYDGVFRDEDKNELTLGDCIIIIDSLENYNRDIQKAMFQTKINGGALMSYEDFCEVFLEKIPVENITDEWLILSRGFENIFSNFYIRAKRLFDIFVSLFGLILASPILLVSAVMIKLDSRGPVIFSQTRSSMLGSVFTIHKLRTMTCDAEKDGAQWAVKNDCRITKVGNFLRKTRIDEIPQLYNVLKGDMSFIGPRPERPEFDKDLQKEIPYYMLRYLVKPGLTGWAQVNHGYGASIEDSKIKLMYDLYYIKNYSFLLDFRIILRTLHIVLFGKGR